MKRLRSIGRSLKRILIRARAWSVARSCRVAPQDRTLLSLVGVLPPPGRFIRGGKVKLVHLRERFGDLGRRFNTAYLVSSTLPSNPDIWVRALRSAGVKVVWNQNGVAYPAWAGSAERVERINAPIRLLQEADFVVYQSKFCKESADKWVGTTHAPSEVVYNYVDTTQFSPDPQPPAARPLRLLVMGTHMTPEKVLIPLEALSLLTRDGFEATLSIIGPCEFQNAERLIADAIRTHGLESRVHRAGRFLQDEAPELYQQHHMFLHLKYMDPCPNAVIEAMACGLPVIGSASGGMPELVDTRSGILLPVPHDWDKLHYPTPDAVADAVRRIGADWHAWSAGARANATARFDVADWLDAHERIFARVLTSR